MDGIELEHVDLQSIQEIVNVRDMKEVDRAYHVLEVNERTIRRIYELNNQTR